MYYLLSGFVYLLSWLPMPVLYVLADCCYIVVYGLLGYRKKMVRNNLVKAFPTLSTQERQKIENEFYRNFFDTWFELIKCATISVKRARQMMTADFTLLEALHAQGKTCQFMCGHMFNWELYNVIIPTGQPYPFLPVYMPLASKPVDKLMYKIRSRFGVHLINATQVKQEMAGWLQRQYMIALGADQRPSNPENGWWLWFLNQPTCVVQGPGRNAVRNNMTVVFAWPQKTGRGRYHLHLEVMAANAAQYTPQQITQLYIKRLQQAIEEQPGNYLWTHNRWKHAWQPSLESLWIDALPIPHA